MKKRMSIILVLFTALALTADDRQVNFSGTMFSGDQRLALINGKVCRVDDVVDGGRITAIEKGSVTLDFSGESRTFRLDTSKIGEIAVLEPEQPVLAASPQDGGKTDNGSKAGGVRSKAASVAGSVKETLAKWGSKAGSLRQSRVIKGGVGWWNSTRKRVTGALSRKRKSSESVRRCEAGVEKSGQGGRNASAQKKSGRG